MPAAPNTIQIDASAHCQLACPSCPTASGATLAVMKAGHLNPGDFQSLLDANPQILTVELSNYGEMFLNPRLSDLLRIAFERGVAVTAGNGTNLNHASEEALEALVRYRVSRLSVSIDGASQASYARYRVKGDFDRVIGHIRRINEYKQKHRSAFPLLFWQFIVFGHNEDEIEDAKRLAAELRMAFRPKISWDDEFSPVRNPELVQLRTGLAATRAEHHRSTGYSYTRGICRQLWNAPVLNWDGRLMGCCRNFWGDFGADAFRDGLTAALASPRIEHARQALMGRAPMDPSIPCATCELYLTMERDGRWITAEEVKPQEPGVILGVVVERGESPATHADVFVAPGHEVNRLMLARPPRAQRIDLASDFSAVIPLAPGDYTVCVLPRRLDPAFRIKYPDMAPVTAPVTIQARPQAQQIAVALQA